MEEVVVNNNNIDDNAKEVVEGKSKNKKKWFNKKKENKEFRPNSRSEMSFLKDYVETSTSAHSLPISTRYAGLSAHQCYVIQHKNNLPGFEAEIGSEDYYKFIRAAYIVTELKVTHVHEKLSRVKKLKTDLQNVILNRTILKPISEYIDKIGEFERDGKILVPTVVKKHDTVPIVITEVTGRRTADVPVILPEEIF